MLLSSLANCSGMRTFESAVLMLTLHKDKTQPPLPSRALVLSNSRALLLLGIGLWKANKYMLIERKKHSLQITRSEQGKDTVHFLCTADSSLIRGPTT